jgi:hypothetical protein
VLNFKIWLFFGESDVDAAAGDFGAVECLAEILRNVQAIFCFKASRGFGAAGFRRM